MFKHTRAFSSFSTDDLGVTKDFYSRVLGIDVREEYGMLFLHLETGGEVVIYPKNDHNPASFTVLNFPVDSIREAVSELTKRGVRFLIYDKNEIKTDEQGITIGDEGPHVAWFQDPAGNILSVLQD